MSKCKYINNGGSHFHRKTDGTYIEVKNGDVIETESNLASRFPEKFQKVSGEDTIEQDSGSSGSDGAFEGQDVTDKFPLAKENDLTVLKDGKKYTILEDGEVITEEPLGSKAAVTDFLNDYVND